ncbi:MAG: hypothetical protein O7C75_15295 [Verrucomicrobia bacterium]|nr:hypothetical protein [Verrucomicrobiota bacterium]
MILIQLIDLYSIILFVAVIMFWMQLPPSNAMFRIFGRIRKNPTSAAPPLYRTKQHHPTELQTTSPKQIPISHCPIV